ncbi:hypothetical protein Hamer_G007994 [Homarus americanus]|uniref:Uncharacterized protein n=1 Tax=Homarus americanus TaxID=6706 RepID=A0A8J5JQT7_HOMAM|nr:hypothetical protein Hamer_G007994 [Homarus americanus]
MLPPQYQQCGGQQPVTSIIPAVWRPTSLHNTSSVAANNHMLLQYQQCGGQQPRVTSTTSSGAAKTTCYLHNTSSVTANNHMLPP